MTDPSTRWEDEGTNAVTDEGPTAEGNDGPPRARGGVAGDGDDAAGQPAFDGGRGPAPEEMSLEELRREIEDIDRELVELIARRTYVADTIADVKAEQGLPTTDESQEEAVMERAGTNAERFDVDANLVKAIFRLLIELNKVEQRERR